MISCFCPHCRTRYDLQPQLQFRKVRCAECQGAFIAPADGMANVVAVPAADGKPAAAAAAVQAPRLPGKRSHRGKRAAVLVAFAALAGGGLFLRAKLSSPPSGKPAPASAAEAPDVPLAPDPAFAKAAPTERVADYPAALERAKATGNDILVLQRGSDWNLLGEKMHRDVWQQEAFVESLGNGFILVAVDRQEKPGAPSVLEGEAAAAEAARFANYAREAENLPASQITALQAESGLVYAPRADGAWLAALDPKKNPAQEVLTVTMSAPAGAGLLRLDFPPDASLPNACSGRASNGNFALSEVTVAEAGKPVAVAAAWANHMESGLPAGLVADGISDKPENAWNAGAHTKKHRTLLLALAAPLAGGRNVTVTLHCRSKWPQHIPGCLRMAALKEPALQKMVVRCGEAAVLAAKNAAFNWQANWNVPRLALLDRDGRAIAAENKPRPPLRASAFAKMARDLRAKRVQRDELWAKAESAAGPDKAELLRQGLDAIGMANSAGNGKCYAAIHEAMKKADPEDKSGAIRWLGFSADPKGGVPWAKPAWNEALDTKNGTVTLTDENYQEALRRVDRELAGPRNKILPKEYIQRMMVAKYHIYKRWKGHEDERFKVQQEIAAVDPATFWGIGGEGYLGEHKRSPMPYLSYGWGPLQVNKGRQTWEITDTSYYFAQPVPHRLTLTHRGGKESLRIRRLSLTDGKNTLAEASPDKDCGPGANAKVVCELDCRKWQPGTRYVLRVEVESTAEKSDSQGSFFVEPIFVEETTQAPPGETWWQRRRSLAAALQAPVMAGDVEAKLSDPSVRRDLATWELLRRCGDAADKVASLPGGTALLDALTKDADWMEAMLVCDNRDWPQVLENLRFLHHHGTGWDRPVYRKMGTAMAMQAGEMNRYFLQDRFRHMQKVHQDGLLHAKFDGLTIREMNWAVWLAGTTDDYQFMVDEMQTTWPDYVGACWGIPYIDPNVYGYSVQGWGYVDPWVHHYGNGRGDRPYRIQRQVGGVCGTLSGYGSAAARSHGVMATTVGQPGHCAYVVRVDDQWLTGNDVFGPETNGASVFEGTGFASMHRLYEAIHADQPALLAASRLAWASHLLLDQKSATVRIRPGLKYTRFRLPGGKLADLPKATAETSGSAESFDLAAVMPADPANFGVVWEGEIEISGTGSPQVSLTGDDAARLVVGGQEIPAGKGWQDVKLAAGVHPVRLEYGQAGGAASLKVEWRSPAAFDPQWLAAARKALQAQPINYPLWLETAKTLEAAPQVPPQVWLESAAAAAKAFSPWHEAGWSLTNRFLAKAVPTLPPADRAKVLLDSHRELRQENAPHYFGFNLGAVLDTQTAWLPDAAAKVEFFKSLLKVHQSENPDRQRVFGEVMAWGQKKLAEKPDTAPLFITALGDYFSAKGDDASKAKLGGMITAGLRKAAEKADRASHQLWLGMAVKMLPPVKPADIFLTDAEAAAAPKPEPFPGSLLGGEATLRLSSASPNDRLLSHAAILAGPGPGFFETNAEEKPWAQVQLAGDCELSGLCLVNRYESPAGSDRFIRSFPCKVSVSTDGTQWTEVALIDQPATVIRLDLQGKAPRARFLRIERQPTPGKPAQKMHFRNILLYGRKLY